VSLPTRIKLWYVNLDLTALPVDVDTLHRLVRALAAQVADDDTNLAAARAEVERLRLIIRRLQRTQFGRRSERLDGDQLALGLEDLDADVARVQASDRTIAVDGAETEPAARRQAFPDHLSRQDMTVDVAGWLCPCCGGTLHVIGEILSEMLDFNSGAAASPCAFAGPNTAAAPAVRSTRQRRLSGPSPREWRAPACWRMCW
jgi:transposase